MVNHIGTDEIYMWNICDDPREHLSLRATLCIILPLCMGHREWRDPLLGR